MKRGKDRWVYAKSVALTFAIIAVAMVVSNIFR